jgi:hypothetical protein
MNGIAPRRADFRGSGADSPLPQRPLLTTPPRLRPPDVARQQRQRLAAQPWLGLGGLLLTAVVFFALALGTGSTATALDRVLAAYANAVTWTRATPEDLRVRLGLPGPVQYHHHPERLVVTLPASR